MVVGNAKDVIFSMSRTNKKKEIRVKPRNLFFSDNMTNRFCDAKPQVCSEKCYFYTKLGQKLFNVTCFCTLYKLIILDVSIVLFFQERFSRKVTKHLLLTCDEAVYLEVENLPDVGQLVVAYIKFLKVLIILKENMKFRV